MKACGRIVPIGDVGPVVPCELSWRITLHGMLELPGRFRCGHHASKYRHLDGQQSVRRDDTGYSLFSVGKMRRHAKFTYPTNSHTFHAVKQSGEHILSIDSERHE